MKNKIYIKFMIFITLLIANQLEARDSALDLRNTDRGCNFLISDLCFSLIDGDELKVSRKVDFYLYDLQFKSGIKIRMYLGFHPKVEPYVEGLQSKCVAEEECYLFFDNIVGTGYLVYLESEKEKKYPKYLHMMFENISVENKAELDNFLKGIRKCKTQGAKTTCDRDIWGKKLPKDELRKFF